MSKRIKITEMVEFIIGFHRSNPLFDITYWYEDGVLYDVSLSFLKIKLTLWLQGENYPF